MKILWITNIPVNTNEVVAGGWMSSLYKKIKDEHEIIISYPVKSCKMITRQNMNNIIYNQEGFWYSVNLSKKIGKIIDSVRPDIIHIWGTEFYHSYATLKALKDRKMENKAVISLQGIISICANKYYSDVPLMTILGISLKDVVKKNAIWYQKILFKKRGRYEKKALLICKNVIGRTHFDKEFATCVNKHICYYYCGELLRDSFILEGSKWSIENADKYRIFISQASYPIKGLHMFLKALTEIKKSYPNVKVYVGGRNAYYKHYPRWKLNSYENYIVKYIEENKLDENVIFLGPLNEEGMKEQYMKCRVFVSPSSIENSPNSIGEAMVIGTPIVASNVGGVSSLINDRYNGILYDFTSVGELVQAIKDCISKDEICLQLSTNERSRATELYDPKRVVSRYLEIYNDIYKKG